MKAIGIGHHPPGSAELNSAKRENHHGHVVQHGVGLATLVHPQSIVDVERLLSLLDQRKLLGNVVAKWIPSKNYTQDKNPSIISYNYEYLTFQYSLPSPVESAWKRWRGGDRIPC